MGRHLGGEHMKKYGMIVSSVFLLLVLICAARVFSADSKADKIQSEHPISTDFEENLSPSSKEELFKAILKLAVWESETREALDKTYGYTDDDLEKPGMKYGLESTEELLENALKTKWYEQRMSLFDTTEKCINDWCDSSKIDSSNVLTLYEKGRFSRIISVNDSLETGSGMEAYNAAVFDAEKEWTALPMDIAYALRPKLITAGCEASLVSAMEENYMFTLKSTIQNAENFENRYGVKIVNLDKAKQKLKRLEYSNKPEIPKVGMSTSAACSTKLGPPTRTTRDSGMWSHRTHYFGYMYWERGDQTIFKASYHDGEITDVWDMRNTKASPNPWRRSSSSSSKSSSSFDPDDHDIEAYYEDNRDVYDDYDDAYEGFLNDEVVWDDY